MTETFEVFFDGDCPLCVREIRMLQRLDRRRRIRFTNIASPQFEPAPLGLSYATLMDRIHGRLLRTGEIVQGVEVFRQLYAAVGFGPVVALTRLPLISHMLDLGYRTFAMNRLRWTGRCEKDATGACTLPARASSNVTA